MALHLCVLGSGSSGNCTFIGSGTTGVLIDAGFSGKETVRRLEEAGLTMQAVHAVCISHEHADHTAGVGVLHRRFSLPLYANSGTIEALASDPGSRELPWQIFTNGTPFWVGDLCVEPFSVPHDAYDPVGFVIGTKDGSRVGIVTDMGVSTSLIRERLRGCRAIVIEANHDEELVKKADRPWSLKQRILGRQGHLSNAGAAATVVDIAGPGLQHVYLAHLSKDCNRGELALRTARKALDKAGYSRVKVSLTFPDKTSEVWKE